MTRRASSVEVNIKKINLREKSVKFTDDCVAVEVPIHIYVNGQLAVTLFCLPTQLKELGIGWLLSEAIVKSFNEITNIKVMKNTIRITCNCKVDGRMKAARTMNIVDSSCGSTTEDFLSLIDRLTRPFVVSEHRVKAERILKNVKILNVKSRLFKLTGGTHSAAIFHKGKLVAFAEDIGRHNAVDKTIGAAAAKNIDFSNCLIASTGRQPANMVLKAARVGIPIVASIAGPIQSGVEAATRTGVTLVCFARGERMNVYSSPERVEVMQNSVQSH